MSGHNIIQQLGETIAAYTGDADLKGMPLFVVSDAAPVEGTDAGWIWLSTAGDDASARLYLSDAPGSKTWAKVDTTDL